MTKVSKTEPAQDDVEPYEVIQPPTSLKAFIRQGSSGSSGIDLEIIAKAEAALAKLSTDFNQWMVDELIALRKMRDEIRTSGLQSENAKELFYALHNLRGQAATLGFPLAGQIASSLCEVIDRVKSESIPPQIIEQHVNAISAIVYENASGQGNDIARKLVSKLCEVTDEYLIHELKRQKSEDTDTGVQ